MKKVFFMLASAVCLLMTSCNSCQREVEPVAAGYNYDEIVVNDYDNIASQYSEFAFYEVDAIFDTTLDVDGERTIVAIRTIFQIADTCIMFQHNSDMTTDTIIVNDWWMECMPMDVRNPVMFDSCMAIINSYRCELPTRYLTFRRVLAPPFPENGQYIFGPGLLVVDAVTGEIVDWNSNNVKDAAFKNETAIPEME